MTLSQDVAIETHHNGRFCAQLHHGVVYGKPTLINL